MRQFFKFVFASMTGFILAAILLFILFFIFISVLVSSIDSNKDAVISSNSVLQIKLDKPLTERTPNPLKSFDFNTMKSNQQPGLYDIVKAIDKAAKDDKIKGIFLNCGDLQGGQASIEEIRNALVRFKASKKFIISYAEYYSQRSYYLASVSDKIYMNPQGFCEFKGYFTELMFFKGLLDKLEIEPQVIRHGKFKSAVEPFITDKMSDENREQIKAFVDDLWHHAVEKISASRNIPAADLEGIANGLKIQSPGDAVKYGLLDDLLYDDAVTKILKEKSGIAGESKLKLVSLNKYKKVPEKKGGFAADKIVVVYATGPIGSGKGDEESVGSETTVEALRKAKDDTHVKAIVFRVNSPGGSALASDVIWREVTLCKKEKPIIVSMGDVAASGGYYISCAADKIFAQPNTITGSIGVFGLLLNCKKLLNDKLGITTDVYKTGEYSDLGMPTKPLSEGARRFFQNSVDSIYSTFTGRVAAGRNMSKDAVDQIGQGRVWSAEGAKEIKLVDEFGGLYDAIKEAAKMVKLEKYRVTELPEQKEPLQEILSELNDETETYFVKRNLGESAAYYKSIKEILQLQGVQARVMFDAEVK